MSEIICGCVDKEDSSCPFAFTDSSERVQNWGCLPTPFEILNMRRIHGKTWACHDQPDKPCLGAIRYLKEKGEPYKVIDKELVTENINWSQYVK